LITEDRPFVAKKNKQQRSSSLTCRRALVQKHYIHTAEGLMKEHKGDKNASISILRPKEVKRIGIYRGMGLKDTINAEEYPHNFLESPSLTAALKLVSGFSRQLCLTKGQRVADNSQFSIPLCFPFFSFSFSFHLVKTRNKSK